MFWEIYQQGRIHEAEANAEAAVSKVERTAGEIAQLKRSVERLGLACQAMWELLRDHTAFTEEMLDQKILEIDLRDGVADGKISMLIVDCPHCGSKSNSKRPSCVICGKPLKKPHAFHA